MKVKGLEGVLKDLQRLNKETKNGVVRALETTGAAAVDVMDSHVPVNIGKLRQACDFEVVKDDLKVILFNNVPYAAYVEFGTGARVDVPAELQTMALQFKGGGGNSGSFDDFIENLILWINKKGITGTYSVKTQKRSTRKNSSGESNDDEDKRIAFLIAMSILKKGLHPQPFLYPAYQFGQKKFIQLIGNLVKGVK